MDLKKEFKPCSFCGKTKSLKLREEDDEYQVICSANQGGCGSSSGWRKSKEETILLWNTRSAEDDLRAELEIMREELYAYQSMAREA